LCMSPTRSPQCVSDCTGKAGHYQHCQRCDKFIQCDNGLLYSMPCSLNTYFDLKLNVCTGALPSHCDSKGNYIGPDARAADNQGLNQPSNQESIPYQSPYINQQSTQKPNQNQEQTLSGQFSQFLYTNQDPLQSLFEQQPAISVYPPQQQPANSVYPPQQQPANSVYPPQQQPANSVYPPQQQPANSVYPPQQQPASGALEDLFNSMNTFYESNQLYTNNLGDPNGYQASNSPPSSENELERLFNNWNSQPSGQVYSNIDINSLFPTENPPATYPTMSPTRSQNLDQNIFYSAPNNAALYQSPSNQPSPSLYPPPNSQPSPSVYPPPSNLPSPSVYPPPSRQPSASYSINTNPGVFSECTTSCKGSKGGNLLDGQYAHCTFCHAFVQCVTGSPTVTLCPEGTFYNRNIFVCDRDNQFCATSKPVQPPAPQYSPLTPQRKVMPSSQPSEEYNDLAWSANVGPSKCVRSCVSATGRPISSGIYAHCDYCNVFVMCSNGYLTEQSCPTKTYFNAAISVCDHDLGNCAGVNTSVSASYSSHTKCVSTCRSVGRVQPDGRYPACSYCNVYLQCKAGQTSIRYCKDGYKYEETLGKCVYDTQGTCKPTQPSSDSNLIPKDTPKPLVPVKDVRTVFNTCLGSCIKGSTVAAPGYYGLCGYCNVFLECQANGMQNIIYCNDGQQYNQASGQCEADRRGECQPTRLKPDSDLIPKDSVTPLVPPPVKDVPKVFNTCLESCIKGSSVAAPGYYGLCGYCNVFLECQENGKEENVFCNDGQQYNQASGQCEADRRGECVPNNPEFPVFSFCINSCKGAADGRYGHCQYCNVYLDCVGQNERLDYCQDGELFNLEVGQCVRDEKQTCLPATQRPEELVNSSNMPTELNNSSSTELLKSSNKELVNSSNMPTELVNSSNTELVNSCNMPTELVNSSNTELVNSCNVPTELVNSSNTELFNSSNTELVNSSNTELVNSSNMLTELVNSSNTELVNSSNTELVNSSNTELVNSCNKPTELVNSSNMLTELVNSSNTKLVNF
ncbi:cell surface glycoprotein 1, partial [Biomphalaria pfeifferi]